MGRRRPLGIIWAVCSVVWVICQTASFYHDDGVTLYHTENELYEAFGFLAFLVGGVGVILSASDLWRTNESRVPLGLARAALFVNALLWVLALALSYLVAAVNTRWLNETSLRAVEQQVVADGGGGLGDWPVSTLEPTTLFARASLRRGFPQCED